MSDAHFFHTKKELVEFISEYLINHDNTIAIIKEGLRKEIVNSLIIKEDFNKINDMSDSDADVLFIIKTGDKCNRNLSLKICNAYNSKTKEFKMVDINNILIVEGLITYDEMQSMIYYEEFTKIHLAETA